MALRFATTSLSFRCLPRAIAASGSTFQIGDGIRFIGTTSTKQAPPLPPSVPTMEMAKSMPLSCQEMDNTSLLTLSALKVKDARSEVLRRHIMSTDNVSYEEACKTFDKISTYNASQFTEYTLPYKVGIGLSVTAGVASFPLCFYLPVVHWFNEGYVTADVPEPQDLETMLEVGSWAWNWMEPPLGQISFFLLCLQFARKEQKAHALVTFLSCFKHIMVYDRSQIRNLGLKPYTAKILELRAEELVTMFPMYDAKIVSDYSKIGWVQLDGLVINGN
eukprot:scaffold155359_cov52-Attheya_sp.AAC.5